MKASGLLLAGIFVGGLGLGLVRLAALPENEPVHHHANWSVWVEGQRVDLSADEFMEDVSACSAGGDSVSPYQRVHMHENNPDVVHVHHEGASWGHLLQNLGWGAGPDWLVTHEGEMYREEGEMRLTWIVNGLVVPPAYDRVIQPGDRLLISFGPESTEELLQDRFPTVSSDAPEYDLTFDPAGCQGAEPETLGERVRRAFWF